MPYWDERTSNIGKWFYYGTILRKYAEEFLETCRNSKYPDEILRAEERALYQRNWNEIIIMADANTKLAMFTPKAFLAELEQAKSREARYDLICIATAALFTYPGRYYQHLSYRSLSYDLFKAKDEYDAEFGKEDLLFLDAFKKARLEVILPKLREYYEHFKRREEEYMESEAQRRIRKEQEAIARAKEIAEKEAAHKERQNLRSEARRKELERFRRLPLTEQLRTIVSGRKIPSYYGLNFTTVSESDLHNVPKLLLIDVITSFTSVKDPAWKELQKKARMVLAE